MFQENEKLFKENLDLKRSSGLSPSSRALPDIQREHVKLLEIHMQLQGDLKKKDKQITDLTMQNIELVGEINRMENQQDDKAQLEETIKSLEKDKESLQIKIQEMSKELSLETKQLEELIQKYQVLAMVDKEKDTQIQQLKANVEELNIKLKKIHGDKKDVKAEDFMSISNPSLNLNIDLERDGLNNLKSIDKELIAQYVKCIESLLDCR